MKAGFGIVAVLVILFVLFAVVIGFNCLVGTGAWGPTKITDATVTRTYIDFSGSGENKSSHYMVATDQGIFEVDNSLLMGIWNSDEIYGKILPGKKYRITSCGNKVVNFIWQEYPYIKCVELLTD